MIDAGLDAVIVTPGANMRYLTGFSEAGYERLFCLIAPLDREPLFVAPSVNVDQARRNPAGIADVREWNDAAGWHGLVEALAGELELTGGQVGVDDDMAARFVLPLQNILADGFLRSAGTVLSDLRSRKDRAELDALQRAASLTDRAYLAGRAACRAGASERDVAAAIEAAIVREGGALSFETIVAAGENSALPHHSPGGRKLAEGDVVTLDLGARVDGYCGDITRIVAIGQPGEDAARVYEIVLRAHRAALSLVRPGVAAEAVDAAARKVIEEAGYGDRFIHRTGHGIGLDDHEQPNIVAGNEHLLRPGECFSIEPGIYLPGRFGIRLENIVAVTESGVRVVNAPIPERIDVAG